MHYKPAALHDQARQCRTADAVDVLAGTVGISSSENGWVDTARIRPIWAPPVIRPQIGRFSQDSCAIKGMRIQDSVDPESANQKWVGF